MPESYDREGLIDRATDAINDGDPTKALEIADEIRKGEGPTADEALIRGIALSSLGRVAEASDAFAEAIRRAPSSHKARFNAAVHEFNAGNIDGAKALADEALKLDPAHGGTRQLFDKIAEHGKPAPVGAVPPPVSSTPKAPAPKPWEPQTGDLEEPLPWIGRLGPNWTLIGVIIMLTGFISLVGVGVMSFGQGGMGGNPTSMAEAIQASQAALRTLENVPLFQFLTFLNFFSRIGAIVWTVLDLNRRRGNFLWLVAVVPLSCLSLSWLVLPIYLLVGRKS